MRYLYAVVLLLFTGIYTFSHGSSKGNATLLASDSDDDNGDDGGDPSKKNYLEVDVQSGLNFTISGPDDFENAQIKPNAIKLKFMTRDSDCSIYAKVATYTTPNGANKNTIPLELELRSNNGKKAMGVVTAPLQLTNYDQRLFVQPKDKQAFNFFYDLKLQPLGYDYPEGQYNFNILFTMTQP